MYPALYNGEIILIFREQSADLIDLKSSKSYRLELKKQLYSFDVLTDGRGSGIWLDVNMDGQKDFVITQWYTGTGFPIQHVCVIDVYNKKVIPKNISMQEIADELPEFNVVKENTLEDGTWESIEIEYELSGKEYTVSIDMSDIKTDTTEIEIDKYADYCAISEDGVLYTKIPLQFNTKLSHEEYIGVVICELVYDSAADEFVLDTMRIVWNE